MYKEAEAIIASYLVKGDSTVLSNGITALQRTTPHSLHDRNRLANCIVTIRGFDDIQDAIGLRAFNAWRGARTGQALRVAGVDVSVHPEILFRGTDRKGQEFVGVIKLQLSKTFSHGEDSAAYAVGAGLARVFARHLRKHRNWSTGLPPLKRTQVH